MPGEWRRWAHEVHWGNHFDRQRRRCSFGVLGGAWNEARTSTASTGSFDFGKRSDRSVADSSGSWDVGVGHMFGGAMLELGRMLWRSWYIWLPLGAIAYAISAWLWNLFFAEDNYGYYSSSASPEELEDMPPLQKDGEHIIYDRVFGAIPAEVVQAWSVSETTDWRERQLRKGRPKYPPVRNAPSR